MGTYKQWNRRLSASWVAKSQSSSIAKWPFGVTAKRALYSTPAESSALCSVTWKIDLYKSIVSEIIILLFRFLALFALLFARLILYINIGINVLPKLLYMDGERVLGYIVSGGRQRCSLTQASRNKLIITILLFSWFVGNTIYSCTLFYERMLFTIRFWIITINYAGPLSSSIARPGLKFRLCCPRTEVYNLGYTSQ